MTSRNCPGVHILAAARWINPELLLELLRTPTQTNVSTSRSSVVAQLRGPVKCQAGPGYQRIRLQWEASSSDRRRHGPNPAEHA
jgi:hypothetical protein